MRNCRIRWVASDITDGGGFASIERFSAARHVVESAFTTTVTPIVEDLTDVMDTYFMMDINTPPHETFAIDLVCSGMGNDDQLLRARVDIELDVGEYAWEP